jgi:hypothetical protein
VTDISSKGLLPQLIDVLHALAEGQELLSRKVRNARLEHNDHMTLFVQTCRQSEFSDFAGPRPFVGNGPTTSIGTLRGHPSDNVELGAGPTSIESFSNGSSPESIGSSAVSASATVPEAASPSNPPAASVTHAGAAPETPARTDWLNSVPPGETTTAPLNRDYNFFDALDAKLADLQDAVDPMGDS